MVIVEQLDLFSQLAPESEPTPKPKRQRKKKTTRPDAYLENENPMVRKYGLTWNGAGCGAVRKGQKPCRFFDHEVGQCQMRNKEHWRIKKGGHDPRFDACGLYQPNKE
ncbi:hypothetical protein [Laceyella putida]|uniref:Uncharacterized protein n=1 Tax=Laceyella putida TaxID=110101 RepID=A0ABW2RKA8_9BACL